jgi:hypothetical protein
MRSIHEVAARLNLSPEEFRRLVDEGVLDNHRLDESCLQPVREAFLKAVRHKPPATRH